MMKYATFVSEVESGNKILIPREVAEKLRIHEGDRVEISVKRFKSSRLDLILSENPLFRLLDLSKSSASPEGT
ncbi:MAG: AbrB/MazE/SpoVT family DNA-binding domain-containing protein [Calditrichaeota bacterium]|nr:AbrB/MazE/SpoVT family DNA-binding domain-containing protein [Calditrichota bacterium]MCB0297560.1 AbrB/MazE/SpoVT family DNA-binding domain-containing protein [Calditrichota bacterium]MCB0303190.1 AbrB/MazE/SpoVT family DNA-binding domain-containing protein [Calditrichota bacterium]MCB9090415.1 AbrB/MazE/SpoVT family DNA-binding domain-containing protein [Calditrichia bacterium]